MEQFGLVLVIFLEHLEFVIVLVMVLINGWQLDLVQHIQYIIQLMQQFGHLSQIHHFHQLDILLNSSIIYSMHLEMDHPHKQYHMMELIG